MEVVNFIKDLNTKGKPYYKIWFPIIMQFQDVDLQTIRLIVPLDTPKTTYYRIINYGLEAFENHFSTFTIEKKPSHLILTKVTMQDQTPFEEPKSSDVNPEQIPPAPALEQPVHEQSSGEVLEPVILTSAPQTPNPRRKKPNAAQTVFSYPDEIYEEIIAYLNQQTGKEFMSKTKKTRQLIDKRLLEGFTVDDFKHVIDVKAISWLNTEQDLWLRPETLFGDKFESYVNEKLIEKKKSNLKDTHDQISRASALRGGGK